MERIRFISKSASDTWGIGEAIGAVAQSGDCFLLYGQLGAGKTQLAKGIAKGLGVKDWEYVVSPSFTLLNIYEGRMRLCHGDLYRIEGTEVEDLDLEEFLTDGIVVVEWAERGSWPDRAIRVFMESTGEVERKIMMEVKDAGRAEVWRDIGKKYREDTGGRKKGR